MSRIFDQNADDGTRPQIVRWHRHNGPQYGQSFDIVFDDGLRVKVMPTHAEDDERAEAIGRRIVDADREAFTTEAQVKALQNEVRDLRERGQRSDATIAELRRTLDRALHGTRAFFGPAVLRPETDGDWGGAVWLLDPRKLESGNGRRFDSLCLLFTAHPELRVTGVTKDGDVLLDAFANIPR